MLQRVSNDLDEPVSIFLHSGQLYYHVGAHHDRALEQFSIITRSEGAMTAGVERTQAFIFDPDYVKGHVKGQDNSGWIVVELERDVKSEFNTEESSGPAFALQRISWTKISRGPWRASEKKEWKHTLDVLRRNHDEKLVVTPSHEEMIKNLGRVELDMLMQTIAKETSSRKTAIKERDEKHEEYVKRELAELGHTDAPHSSESSDRPKKRKLSEEITWENNDEKNIKILALEHELKEEDIAAFETNDGGSQRSYRSTIDGELLGIVYRPRIIEKETNSVPCHPEQQSSTADPCTAVQSEAGAHQSSPLLE